MSLFKGKDDARYMGTREAQDRACNKQDEKKADRKNGDVSKAAKFLW